MIEATAFLDAAAAIGIGFYTGVPCSFLTPLINRTASDRTLRYVGAASEGEAVAIAAGAWLAGRETAVMCQNSGLGNAVNPLTSLNTPFRIPTLLIVTWRGQPGLNDEPQHELMGRITQSVLDVIGVPHRRFPDDPDAIGPVMREARSTMARTSLPFALVLEKGTIRDEPLDEPPRPPLAPGRRIDLREGGSRPTRLVLLEAVLASIPDDVPIVATTGKAGRELFTLADREQHIYQVGSMGCASPMGLGVAMTTGRRTVVLDGDGAALMKLGSMATIGAYQPAGLLHVLLDNGVHDSTGGQTTVSQSVDFAAVALACGYRHAFACDSAVGFAEAFRQAMAVDGPILVHALIRPGSVEKLGRPTIAPHEVAQRFRGFLDQVGRPSGQAAD
jgi:phosphonopyruvate decarboxylase